MFGLNISRKLYMYSHFHWSVGAGHDKVYLLESPLEEDCKDYEHPECKPSYYWCIGFKVFDSYVCLPPWTFSLALYFVISLVVKLCLWGIAHTDGASSTFLGKLKCFMSSQCLLSMCPLTSFTTACTELLASGYLRA